ncbi:zinc finger protein 568 isoform X1 [Hydra vulgaris]|uniref:zinc finger protein 568 isoform X1 n=1 Tax=Hydra vulgaris TaxID=6087 RepID=UPI001F5F79A8|nr:zinc finger protein 568-like [Hydra vulgaris]
MDLTQTDLKTSILVTEAGGTVNEHFNIDTKSNDIDSVYSCLECNSVFQEAVSLNLHINSKHSSSKKYVCEECDAMFFSSYKFKLHCSSKHNIVRPFKCGICINSYSNISALKIHLRSHEENPPSFKCTLCGRSFATKSSLKTHSLRHGSEMPHICDVCNKSFAIKGDLRTHYLKHDPIPQFKCDFCTKAFPRKGNLIRHMRKHTGEKPYVCLYCEKRFSRSENCREHQRTHTNEKRFMCNICGACFSDSGNFCKHKKQKCNKKAFNLVKSDKKSKNLSTNIKFSRDTLEKSLDFVTVKTCHNANENILYRSHVELSDSNLFPNASSTSFCESIQIAYHADIIEQVIHPDKYLNGQSSNTDAQSVIPLNNEKTSEDGRTDGHAFFLVDHFDPNFSFNNDSNLFIDTSIFLQQQNESDFQSTLYNDDKQFNRVSQTTNLLLENSEYYCEDDNEIDTNKFLNDDYLLTKKNAVDAHNGT